VTSTSQASPRDSWIDAPLTCFINTAYTNTSLVTTPVSGNILDLILTSDDQPSGQLVSEVTVRFSDHRLVKCRFGVPPTLHAIVTYSYRSLRKIDITSFGRNILCSRLYNSSVADVDEFAELFDSEVQRKAYTGHLRATA